MHHLNSREEDIFYGGEAHRPAETISLKAGSFSCRYEAGYLRYIKAGSTELIRMIYPAVRDHNWKTLSPQISDEHIVQDEHQFHISYDCRYTEDEIDFLANFRIRGDADGNIYFEMLGEALSTFRKNRIGFNVLHPPEAAGAACIVQHTNGTEEEGIFPKWISPHQPFMDMERIRWKMDGIGAQIDFEGDIFEMEDQRNWTDASFKTYSTPLGRPFPVTVKKGEIIKQSIKLSIGHKKIKPSGNDALSITVGNNSFQIPDIGIGQSSEIKSLEDIDLKYLKAIRFAHYRVDLKLSEQDAVQQWERAVRESYQLRLPLELALHFSEHVEDELKQFARWVKSDQVTIKQVLVFSINHKSTPKALLDQAIPALKKLLPETQMGAGTDCFFTELNRERVETRGLDFLTYSLNPQVHQFDNQSLTETLKAQSYTVASAKQFSKGLPLHISPLTLKMRFNPNATGPEPEVPAGQLPPQVDTRQISLFAAGWTLGSLKYLIESRLSSVTYFETLGMRGIMQGNHEPAFPDKFKTEKGMLYPMYWIFYWLLQSGNAKMIHTQSSDPLQVEGLVWEINGVRMLLLANFQAETLEVEVKGWKEQYECKMLDENHFETMTKDPETFLILPWQKTQSSITLLSYALCILR